jgi:hypothetical protein
MKPFDLESIGKIKPMSLVQCDIGIQAYDSATFQRCLLVDPIHQFRTNANSSVSFIDGRFNLLTNKT